MSVHVRSSRPASREPAPVPGWLGVCGCAVALLAGLSLSGARAQTTIGPLEQLAGVVYKQPPYVQYDLERDVVIDGVIVEHRILTVYAKGATRWRVVDGTTGIVSHQMPDGGNIFAAPNCADVFASAPACITGRDYRVLSTAPADSGPQGAVHLELEPKGSANPLTDVVLDSQTWRVVELDSTTTIQVALDKSHLTVPARLSLYYDAVRPYYALSEMKMLGTSGGHEILMDFRFSNITTPEHLDDSLFEDSK